MLEQIDKAKLLEWLQLNGDEQHDDTAFETGYSACCNQLIELIEQGSFAPDQAPVPLLQKGDKVRHKDDKTVSLGVVLDMSKTGKMVRVKWTEFDRKIYLFGPPHPAYYKPDKLIKIQG